MSDVINLRPVTNSEDWYDVFEAHDEDADTPFDFTGWALSLKVGCPDGRRSGPALISASDTDGRIEFPAGRDSGQFSVTVPASAMACMEPNTYPVGIIMEKDGDTVQLVLARLPIVDGVV